MTICIAEIGINANGSIDLAKKLIDAAQWCGADFVKFQKRDIHVVYEGQLDLPRESPWGKTLGDQKFGLEFNRADYDEIDAYCEKVGIPWFCSAWDINSLEFLRKYDLPYNKIASAMATHKTFVKEVAKEGKPTFLSTGMCTFLDIDMGVSCFALAGNRSKLTLMHCVGVYPCPEADLNLSLIPIIQARYGLPVGYSGHEASVSPSVVAVALGAIAIERHLTLDRSMYGSDQAASLEPVGFKTMVDQIRKVPEILGDGIKRIIEAEKPIAKKLRYWVA